MRVTSKGQVTIPVAIRDRLGLHPGSVVEFGVEGDTAVIYKLCGAQSRGRRLVVRVRGRATSGLTTEAIMSLTRRRSPA